MTSDLETFRAELRAAGQPHSLWGVRVIGLGLAILAGIDVLSNTQPKVLLQFGLLFLAAALLALMVGAGLLIVAAVRRRRWAKAQNLVMPGLSDLP
jgi:hypothetical protein